MKIYNINLIPAVFEIILAVIFMICFSHFANASTIDDAEKAIASEITKASGISDVGIKFVKGQAYLNSVKTDKLEITSLNVDSDKKIFAGYVSVNNSMPVFVSGRFFKSVSVPVLNVNASRTDVIKADNISLIDLDADKVAAQNIITDQNELIGKSPSRGISKNRPISKQQVGNAVLVTKQQDINIIFRAGNIQINDIGTAMDDGAAGDVIRIRNKISNKVISGVVQDSKTAIISREQQKLAKL